MAKYKDKWKTTFPAAIGNQTRPSNGVDNTQEYNTDGLPQYIANDPVRYDLQNAVNSQLVSNDERLNEKIERTSDDLAAHNKDPKAHATGIAGNAATATKLQTARALSLTGKAAGSATFDGSANASINVTSVNADTASKLSTARKINITGNATGAAAFDGSGDVSISTTVNESKHAANADTAANANKLASESGSNYLFINTEEDNWSVIGQNPGNWLKSIRTDVSAPPYSIGNYSTAIAFGGRDTKGIITHAYNSPDVKFAGGAGSTASWKFTIHGGANNEFYDLNNFPTKTGNGASGTWGINISGNAASATTANTATNASHASNADSATKIVNNGNRNNIANGAKPPSGLSVYQCYGNTGYPQQYGNVVSIGGTGDNELFLSWFNDSRLLYRAKRDQDTNWTNWRAIAFTDEINNYAPTKTGGGASGTWGINISGNAASATNADKLDGYHASDLLSKIYPVGSIYMSMSATTPATLFGVGTWKRISQGRMLLGADDSTYKAGATGGEATHTLTAAEMPAHSHGISTSGNHSHYFYGSDNDNGPLTEGDGLDTEGNGHFTRNVRFTTSSAGAHTHTISNSGGGAAHNNMSPYLVCYIWQRMA